MKGNWFITARSVIIWAAENRYVTYRFNRECFGKESYARGLDAAPATQNPDERYVYEERLALLAVIEREPTEQEHKMGMADFLGYRKRVGEFVEEMG